MRQSEINVQIKAWNPQNRKRFIQQQLSDTIFYQIFFILTFFLEFKIWFFLENNEVLWLLEVNQQGNQKIKHLWNIPTVIKNLLISSVNLYCGWFLV